MKQAFIYGVDRLPKRISELNKESGKLGSVVSIGAFDGVHLGHQAILKQAVAAGKRLDLPSAALLFEPLPREYFQPDSAPPRLQPLRERVESIFECGVDRVVCLRFNAALSALEPEEFVKQILVAGLGVKHIIVGEDFRFGSNRAGGKTLLSELAAIYGFDIVRPETIEFGGERISSTRIRALLAQSDFEQVANLLGRPYTMSGRVCYGKQLGRQLGFPTANIALRRRRSPLLGTFAVKVDVKGQIINGVANIGVRPTVNRIAKPQLEVHLFDFKQNIYGEEITVEFCFKIRDEQKFGSVEELKKQIALDMEQAKNFFS